MKKNILIVGASSGIGEALAQRLVTQGEDVHIYGTFFRNPRSSLPNLSYHPLDACEVEFTLDFLPEQLHGLVYCPGEITLTHFSRVRTREVEESFRLQVSGAIRTIQLTLPKLQAAKSSSIVLFSTVAVQSGFRFHTQVSTIKGAIEGLGRALAAELAPKTRVNIIAPSITQTPLSEKYLNSEEKKSANAKRHALGRVGTPDDIAAMAEFLLMDRSSWITGQVFNVDGGISTLKT